MPWKEQTKMEEKERFIREMNKHNKPFNQLCKDFGISEKTGYKWKKRFLENGTRGLQEHSKAPLQSPSSLSEDVVLALVALKQAHPYWGAKKILALFQKAYKNLETPSLSSTNRILRKAGLTKRHRVLKASTDSRRLHQRILPEQVNDVWALDFKGWWKSSGEICEPFNIIDLTSRKILCSVLMASKSSCAVREVMTKVFRKYGLPKVIRSDNGTPFAAPNGLLNLTDLSIWWITLGILPDRTEKGTPGQNGSIERMHADMAREIEAKIPGGRTANQAALDAWVEEYNSVRPHEALAMKTPDEVYKPSERKYQGDCDEIEYPFGFLRRKVYSSGEISVDGIRVTISYALRGYQVGLKPNGDNTYETYIADFLLGTLDMNSCCFTPLDCLR